MFMIVLLASNASIAASRPSRKWLSDDNDWARDASFFEICPASGAAPISHMRAFGGIAIDASVVILSPCSDGDVMTNMFSPIHDAKVGHGVIRDVVVNVMDNFVGEEKASQTEHDLVSMLKDIPIFSRPWMAFSDESKQISLATFNESHADSIPMDTIGVNK